MAVASERCDLRYFATLLDGHHGLGLEFQEEIGAVLLPLLQWL